MSILSIFVLLSLLTLAKSQAQQSVVPKCDYNAESATTSEESLSWSISSNTDYLLDLKGRHVVHFDCQCVDFKNYKGTFSQMLSNPLSTVPLLHLRRNANVTIDVNLFHCGKLKMALDFTELLAQRSASNIDFVMKISHTRKVHISKIQVASNQTHVVSFHNVPGKITLSGKVDCIGCSIASSKVRVTRESDTILALFVNTVSNFAIEQAEVISPLRVTARNVDRLLITDSTFLTIPWPGFYVYNATKVSLKNNFFKAVAPRSLVFKKGQLLEVSHNFLKDASTIDASEYTSMNIFCNYAAEKEQTEECSITSIPEDSNDINGRSNENSMTIAATAFLASLNTLFWHFWWIIPIIIISLLALYKYIMGVNEPDDPPLYPRSLQQANVATNIVNENTNTTENTDEISQKSNCSYCCCYSFQRENVNQMEVDEYSNSSRLHLAGDSAVVVESFYQTDGAKSTSNYSPYYSFLPEGFYTPESNSSYMRQLERLSLTSSQPLANNDARENSPIGYDLWNKQSNGIPHIDSDETENNTFNKSSAEDSGSNAVTQPTIVPRPKHPSSNYVYKNEPLKISF